MESRRNNSCLQSFTVKLGNEGISIQRAPARESTTQDE